MSLQSLVILDSLEIFVKTKNINVVCCLETNEATKLRANFLRAVAIMITRNVMKSEKQSAKYGFRALTLPFELRHLPLSFT